MYMSLTVLIINRNHKLRHTDNWIPCVDLNVLGHFTQISNVYSVGVNVTVAFCSFLDNGHLWLHPALDHVAVSMLKKFSLPTDIHSFFVCTAEIGNDSQMFVML